MSKRMLAIPEINALDQAGFVATFGGLFEGTPQIAADTWPARPFADFDQLHAALCATMHRMTNDQKIALIQAHPDLAGKAAIAGELTPESTSEQVSAGLNRLTPEEFASFTQMNRSYSEAFSFPFVICVREHTKYSILDNFRIRLQNNRSQEIATALGEIAKIAGLRLRDIVR